MKWRSLAIAVFSTVVAVGCRSSTPDIGRALGMLANGSRGSRFQVNLSGETLGDAFMVRRRVREAAQVSDSHRLSTVQALQWIAVDRQMGRLPFVPTPALSCPTKESMTRAPPEVNCESDIFSVIVFP